MKKKYKVALALGSLAIGATVINNAIFKMHNKRSISDCDQNFYRFKYGDIRYVVRGEGEPLLLIHDIFIGSSLKQWEDSINYFSQHYKVYAIDLLGFGGSEKPAISYSSYLYISLINNFITDVIKEKSYVVASSGSAGFAVLASSLDSNNFKKLILISPVNGINFYSKFLCRLIESPVIGTTIYNIMSSRFYRKSFLENIVFFDSANASNSIVDSCNHTAHLGGASAKYPIALLMSGYLDVNMSQHLEKISVPTHIIWGAENRLNSIENYDSIKHLNQSIDMTVIDQAGLLPQSERPHEFFKACRDFLIL